LNAETTETSEVIEDVQTVADEILVEVKECRIQLSQTMADLERLQSEGGPAKSSQVVVLETEVKNLREEMRNLLAELKALQVPALMAEDLRQSTQLQSQPPEVTITEINPVEAEAARREAERPPKKKRFRI
jgi:chromosome segregation ATPase